MTAVGARDVILLVGDGAAEPAARAAADLVPSVTVTLVRTRNVAEMVAAALAFDPTAAPARNAERMGHEAARLRTVAIRTIEGSLVAVDGGGRAIASAPDLAGAVVAGIRAIAGDGFELATIYVGVGPDDGVATAARDGDRRRVAGRRRRRRRGGARTRHHPRGAGLTRGGGSGTGDVTDASPARYADPEREAAGRHPARPPRAAARHRHGAPAPDVPAAAV